MADIREYIEQLQDLDFNEIDWERIGVWPLPARVFLIVLAVIAIFVACHFVIVKDKLSQLEFAQEKEQTLRKSFQDKAFDAANLERYRVQMIEMDKSFGALISRLPSDTEVPDLLEDIDDKGVESRLTIDTIDLQSEIASEFYIELPIQINVSGGYHEFGTFISGVAGMPRIVTLHDFAIQEKSGQAGLLNMTITAKTYRYNAPGEE